MPDFNRRTYSKLSENEITEIEGFFTRKPIREDDVVDNSTPFMAKKFNIP